MSETAEKLKLELSLLSPQERAEIAHFLIQSLDGEVDNEMKASWDMELTKRLEEINSGNAVGEPPSQVFSQLREKYS